MKIIILIITILTSFNSFSQKELYAYDEAGNRIQRKICTSCKRSISTLEIEVFQLNATILPNPTQGEMVIEVKEEGVLAGEESSDFHVLVYDVVGRAIVNERFTTVTFKIDISNQAPGIYFVKLNSAEKIKRWEIIKD
jgi:hypothetical protein